MNYSELILKYLPHAPTEDQNEFIVKIDTFLNDNNPNGLMLLKGYAGTGKTTLIAALVNGMRSKLKRTKLLAPTGRAAKVIAAYSQQNAYTIHKEIYYTSADNNNRLQFSLKENKSTQTLYIIDEASMINEGSFGTGILSDLIDYVYSGMQCKILMVGDTAQLPPVGTSVSPALNVEHLEFNYNKSVTEVELQTVVRQKEDGGILNLATQIRELQKTPYLLLSINIENCKDIHRPIDRYEVENTLVDSIAQQKEDSVIIVRSNKRANLYNQQIRARILDLEEELSVGDRLMILRNNYSWLPKETKMSFIANGDIVEVKQIKRIEEIYESKFAHVFISFVDYPNETPISVTLNLSTLFSEAPNLTTEEWRNLYDLVQEDLSHLNARERYKKIKENKYMNALQVKFAYAITCHKAQGGQWKNVIIEKPFLKPEDEQSQEYYRWLYTAVTRAKENLYLLGFPNSIFE